MSLKSRKYLVICYKQSGYLYATLPRGRKRCQRHLIRYFEHTSREQSPGTHCADYSWQYSGLAQNIDPITEEELNDDSNQATKHRSVEEREVDVIKVKNVSESGTKPIKSVYTHEGRCECV